MIAKTEVVSKLDELKAYSVQQKPNFETQYTTLMAPLYSSVNSYFDTKPDGIKDLLEEYVFQKYCDICNRGMVWENPVENEMPTDYPVGYSDARECFYTFESIMSATPEAFFAAWVEGVPTPPEGESGGGATPATPEPLSNSLLDVWTPEVQSAPTDDLGRIQTVIDWCASAASSGNMINLLEDQGRVLESKGQKEIAQMIYIDQALLEVNIIRDFGVYVPTYLKDAAVWTEWKQPTLTENGTVGGDFYACRASTYSSEGNAPYMAFDGLTGDGSITADSWVASGDTAWLEFYSPVILKLDSVEVQNRAHPTTRPIKDFSFSVSLDGESYTEVASGTNPSDDPNESFTAEFNGVECKYIRLNCLTPYTKNYAVGEMRITAKQKLTSTTLVKGYPKRENDGG